MQVREGSVFGGSAREGGSHKGSGSDGGSSRRSAGARSREARESLSRLPRTSPFPSRVTAPTTENSTCARLCGRRAFRRIRP